MIGDATYLGHAFVYTVAIGPTIGAGESGTGERRDHRHCARSETGSAALAAGEPVSSELVDPNSTTVVAE